MSKVLRWAAHSLRGLMFLKPYLDQCESENHSPAPIIQPGKLSWKVRLRYAPPSGATDSNGNLAPPWWLPPLTTPVTSDVVEPAPSVPVSGLEGGVVEEETSGSGGIPAPIDTRWCVIQALDGNPRRSWWHCSGCGRINQRDMLIHRRCPSCQVCTIYFFLSQAIGY